MMLRSSLSTIISISLSLSDRTVVLERGAATRGGPSKELRDDLVLRRKVL
jgi:branched-chain amino acid transport system ATP-binding protein